MASIQKREKKDGSVSYQVSVVLGRAGEKRVRKTATWTPPEGMSPRETERALWRFVDEFEERCKTGAVQADRLTFYDFAEDWLKSYAEKNVERTTYARYESALRNNLYPRIGHVMVSDIRPPIVRACLEDLAKSTYQRGGKRVKYSAETVRSIKIILSTVLASAVADGLLESNPCAAARQRRSKKVAPPAVKCFTIEQAVRFLEIIERPIPLISPAHVVKRNGKDVFIRAYQVGELKVQTKYRAAFQLAIFAGLRKEEVLGLKWRDVDFEEMSVDINKAIQYTAADGLFEKTPKSSSGYRKLYLPAAVFDTLHALKRETMEAIMLLGTAWRGSRNIEENWCFTQAEGQVMHTSTPNHELGDILKAWNRQCENEADKLPVISFHELRHTCASILIANGMEATAVAKRLGHHDASVTLQIYAHSFEERDRAASDIMENALLPGRGDEYARPGAATRVS